MNTLIETVDTWSIQKVEQTKMLNLLFIGIVKEENNCAKFFIFWW